MSSLLVRTFAATGAIVAFLAAAGCGDQGRSGVVAGTSPEGPVVKVSVFEVEGMTCGHCEQAIQATVGAIQGVETVEASHTEKKAVVRYDAARVKPEAISAAIEKLGYKSRLRSES